MIDSYISAAEARAKRVEVLIEKFIKDNPKIKKELDSVFNKIHTAASEGKMYIDITDLDFTIKSFLLGLGYEVVVNSSALASYAGIEKKLVYRIAWVY